MLTYLTISYHQKEENAIEQPNDISENELLKIKTLINAYAESIVTPFDKGFNFKNREEKRSKNLNNLWKKLTMLWKLFHC